MRCYEHSGEAVPPRRAARAKTAGAARRRQAAAAPRLRCSRACRVADDAAVTRRRLPLQHSLTHHVTSCCTTRVRWVLQHVHGWTLQHSHSLHVRTFDCGCGVCCHAWLTHHLHSGHVNKPVPALEHSLILRRYSQCTRAPPGQACHSAGLSQAALPRTAMDHSERCLALLRSLTSPGGLVLKSTSAQCRSNVVDYPFSALEHSTVRLRRLSLPTAQQWAWQWDCLRERSGERELRL